MSKLEAPLIDRTMEMALDYADKEDLVSKLEDMLQGIKDDSPMVTYDHPDWLRTRWNCCGGSGP